MADKTEDHWSSEAYQNSASFVPKLATKVLKWLDVTPDDRILDIGCGDGVLNLQIAQVLAKGNGTIHGIDSSPQMISAAQASAAASLEPKISKICTFEVSDATHLPSPSLPTLHFTKIFSNAFLHWILRLPSTRIPFFRSMHKLLAPSGLFVFEMGGYGNCAEMRTALLAVISRRIGIEKAREVDPWFFPDEDWMRGMFEGTGDEEGGKWKVERLERKYRSTRVDEGGVEGWVRLMGGRFLEAVRQEERERCVKEVCEVLKTVCESPSGGDDCIGYVRLRGVARKI